MSAEELRRKWRGQMLKGLLELMILSYIRENPGSYGYLILQKLRNGLILTQEIADGPVYAVLNRLVTEGVLDATISQVEGRKRKTFRVTELGNELFDLIESDWDNVRKLESL